MTGGWWCGMDRGQGGGLDTERVLVLYFRYLSLWPGDFWPGGWRAAGGQGGESMPQSLWGRRASRVPGERRRVRRYKGLGTVLETSRE